MAKLVLSPVPGPDEESAALLEWAKQCLLDLEGFEGQIPDPSVPDDLGAGQFTHIVIISHGSRDGFLHFESEQLVSWIRADSLQWARGSVLVAVACFCGSFGATLVANGLLEGVVGFRRELRWPGSMSDDVGRAIVDGISELELKGVAACAEVWARRLFALSQRSHLTYLDQMSLYSSALAVVHAD